MKKKANEQFTLFDRRKFIKFFGLSSAIFSSGVDLLSSAGLQAQERVADMVKNLSWKPVDLAIPMISDGLTPDQQIEFYSEHEVQDDLLLPEGFTYNVIASWGDPVGDSRYGYNNDHVWAIPDTVTITTTSALWKLERIERIWWSITKTWILTVWKPIWKPFLWSWAIVCPTVFLMKSRAM